MSVIDCEQRDKSKIVEPSTQDTNVIEPETTIEAIVRLAALPPLEYEQVRKQEATRLRVRLEKLDEQVEARRKAASGENLEQSRFAEPEPWPDPVVGHELLDQLVAVFRQYLVLPDYAAEALALWVPYTHAYECFDISPYLAITSPSPGCGKSQCLTLLGALVRRPLPSSNISPAGLFRAIDKWQPTLLIDEGDTFVGASDELRGVLNSGHHRQNAYVIRATGENHEPKQFSTWCPKAIAQIGKLPPTLASRSIHIELQRKTAAERVAHLRLDRLHHLVPLRRQAAQWIKDNSKALQEAEPVMPINLGNRTADNWRPLIAIADLAGGDWPRRARAAAESLGGHPTEQDDGIKLLRDIQRIFDASGADRIFSADLAQQLAEMEDRPWPEWRQGKAISPPQIARLLQPFGIIPSSVRSGADTAKGYKRTLFEGAFTRYLLENGVTPSQVADLPALRPDASRHNLKDVTSETCSKVPEAGRCDVVTDADGCTGAQTAYPEPSDVPAASQPMVINDADTGVGPQPSIRANTIEVIDRTAPDHAGANRPPQSATERTSAGRLRGRL